VDRGTGSSTGNTATTGDSSYTLNTSAEEKEALILANNKNILPQF
jgi:hypothetical protein